MFVPEAVRTYRWALLVVLVGVWLADWSATRPAEIPTLASFGIFVALIGCFLTCYGPRVLWLARFPLAFTIFAIPLPATVLRAFISWLQQGSAAVVHALFWLLNVSFVRDGMRFEFANFGIEIARECSGIRSSFALAVLTVLISDTALKAPWRKLLLVATVIPVVLMKNGIRIVTLTILALKVDPSALDSPLHHSGGFVFFGLALGIEGLLCFLLARSERGARVTERLLQVEKTKPSLLSYEEK